MERREERRSSRRAKREPAIRRRDHGEETLAEIGRSYNVNGWTIGRLGA